MLLLHGYCGRSIRPRRVGQACCGLGVLSEEPWEIWFAHSPSECPCKYKKIVMTNGDFTVMFLYIRTYLSEMNEKIRVTKRQSLIY